MMKIMLVQPSERADPDAELETLAERKQVWPVNAYGLACIAGYLEDIAEVKIVEANQYNVSIAQICQMAQEFGADMIGISQLAVSCFGRCVRLSQHIKESMPQVSVVMGGHSATFQADELLASGYVDMVVRGEGELTMRELVEHEGDPSGIDGISYLDEDGQIVHNPPRQERIELDTRRPPARHLLGNSPELLKIVETSRGCPFNCIFCSVRKFYGRGWRSRSVESVLEEIRTLVEDYGARSLFIGDDNFTVNMDRVRKLCEGIIDAGWELDFWFQARVDSLAAHPDVVALLGQAGFKRVLLGVESGNTAVLDLIRKGTTQEQAAKAVKLLQENGIMALALFVIGARNETWEMMQETAEYAASLEADGFGFNILTPYPGSDLFEESRQDGTLLSLDWNDYDELHRLLDYQWIGVEWAHQEVCRIAYIRSDWLATHIPHKGEKNLIRTDGAKLFWKGTMDTIHGRPDHFKWWREIALGLGRVDETNTPTPAVDYSADILLHTTLGSALLQVEGGRIVDFVPLVIDVEEDDYDLVLTLDNDTLIDVLAVMNVDALSAFLSGQITTNSDVDEVLAFCNWMNAFQTSVDMNLHGPPWQEPAGLQVLNAACDGRSLACEGCLVVGPKSEIGVYLEMHDGCFHDVRVLEQGESVDGTTLQSEVGLRHLFAGDVEAFVKTLAV